MSVFGAIGRGGGLVVLTCRLSATVSTTRSPNMASMGMSSNIRRPAMSISGTCQSNNNSPCLPTRIAKPTAPKRQHAISTNTHRHTHSPQTTTGHVYQHAPSYPQPPNNNTPCLPTRIAVPTAPKRQHVMSTNTHCHTHSPQTTTLHVYQHASPYPQPPNNTPYLPTRIIIHTAPKRQHVMSTNTHRYTHSPQKTTRHVYQHASLYPQPPKDNTSCLPTRIVIPTAPKRQHAMSTNTHRYTHSPQITTRHVYLHASSYTLPPKDNTSCLPTRIVIHTASN